MRSRFYEQFKSTWLTTLFSLILFIAVSYFLFWNETRAIITYKSLKEALQEVISINPFDERIKTAYEGKLVYITGPLNILEPLAEPDYNIQVSCVKLRKRVQMYQWIEENREHDGFGDTLDSDREINKYSYSQDWRDYLVDSNQFYIRAGHHNPKDMPASSQTHIAENVKIGYVYLSIYVKRKFNDYWDITSDERPDRQDIKLHSGMYYHGVDPLIHETGDLRVMFSYAGRQNDEYSVIGSLQGGTIQPYIVNSSKELLILMQKGKHSPAVMIEEEHKEMGILAWRYRIIGWFQMFAATMSLHPDWFSLLLESDWVSPKLSSYGRLQTNLILTTCFTLFIVSVAWIFSHPVASLILLLVSISPFVYFSKPFPYRRISQNEHLQ